MQKVVAPLLDAGEENLREKAAAVLGKVTRGTSVGLLELYSTVQHGPVQYSSTNERNCSSAKLSFMVT